MPLGHPSAPEQEREQGSNRQGGCDESRSSRRERIRDRRPGPRPASPEQDRHCRQHDPTDNRKPDQCRWQGKGFALDAAKILHSGRIGQGPRQEPGPGDNLRNSLCRVSPGHYRGSTRCGSDQHNLPWGALTQQVGNGQRNKPDRRREYQQEPESPTPQPLIARAPRPVNATICSANGKIGCCMNFLTGAIARRFQLN